MKLTVVETIGVNFEVIKKVATFTIYPFDTGVGAIKESVITAEGSLIIGNASAEPSELTIGNNGEVLTADSTASGGMLWKPGGGSTTQQMTNNNGSSLAVGDVVVIDTDNDTSVMKTTVPSDLRVCGIAAEVITDGSAGAINTLGGAIVTVNVDTGAISRGEYLVSSATSGQAKSAGYFNSYAAFAIALTAKTAGSAGTVQAMLLCRVPLAIKGTTSWAIGGDNASSALTDSQKFIQAAATWATVGGAALPVGKGTVPLGMGDTNVAGHVAGGSGLLTAYKMSYATETMAANAGMNLAINTSYMVSGENSPTKGYRTGGYTSAWVKTSEKFDFATDTRAAITSLSAADTLKAPGSDGSYIHVVKATGWKITVAADTGANSTGLNRTVSYATSGQSYPATAAYVVDNLTCIKIDFASGNQSTLGSSPATQHIYCGAVTDGIAYGWACGMNASPYSTSDKFTKSTETWSADGGAAMNPGKHSAAYFNNGAY